MGKKEGTGAEVVKLTTIIALDTLNGHAVLCSDIGKKVRQCGKGVRLEVQRKRPVVVRKIIEDDQVILVTRDANKR